MESSASGMDAKDAEVSIGNSIRPCHCPLLKRIQMLEAASAYQLIVAKLQNLRGLGYNEACWKAYYTVKERWGDRYPFWDAEFGLDVHQDVIDFFRVKDNGNILAAALMGHQFMIRTTQLVRLECYLRQHTAGCMEYMEGRKLDIYKRLSRLPMESQMYLSEWRSTFVDRLPTSMRHIINDIASPNSSTAQDNGSDDSESSLYETHNIIK